MLCYMRKDIIILSPSHPMLLVRQIGEILDGGASTANQDFDKTWACEGTSSELIAPLHDRECTYSGSGTKTRW
jgi:hypothetical protein